MRSLFSYRSIQVVTVLSLLFGWTGASSMAAAAEAVPTQVAAQQVSGTGTTPATTTADAEAQGYEAREAQAKSLETFKGGEPVVIYTSTAVLVIAIILLVVLI